MKPERENKNTESQNLYALHSATIAGDYVARIAVAIIQRAQNHKI